MNFFLKLFIHLIHKKNYNHGYYANYRLDILGKK